ncbi:hypothetical protein BS47DRAFT_1483461 [Hydnum rufescens UP504]|uniref:Probable RNA polymerase II nuclear localization protein SLC7A6OS n=1 Tax=Hydnum rufescens UP504 TaxID=1448309 RepID=A0A9P6B3X9_9AGAM|nr:hypothetical protein BS47DRAFT_1483461 [Hydnum rufescens UP504]
MELPQRDASSANQSSLTLLRIKRKRSEEPLDALVVDLPRKKYRDATFGRHPGIFKFLETVDEERFFQHEANTRELQNRISSLSSIPDTVDPTKPPGPIPNNRSGPGPRQYNIVKADLNSTSPSTESPDTPQHPHDEPSSKDSITLYDGIDLPGNVPNIAPEPHDPEMEMFSTMVRDYLSLQNVRPSLPSPMASAAATRSEAPNAPPDFVYDVFYYDKKEKAGQSMDLDQLANVGLVMVRPEDRIEFLNDSDDETDSDYVDDEDPDSNDENNPANDYPDETDSDDANWGSDRGPDYSDDDMDEIDDHED